MSNPAPSPTEAPHLSWVPQSYFLTGELPWAGRKGPEVKAKLEAGESPALDPLVPAPYQALVRAGLGLGPADRCGSLQSTRYLLREAMAQVQDRRAGEGGSHGTSGRACVPHPASSPQDSASEVSSPRDWAIQCPPPQGSLPG